MGHVIDFNPDKTAAKKLALQRRRELENERIAEMERSKAAGIAPVPTPAESQAALKVATDKAVRKAATESEQLPIRVYAIQNRISAVEVSRMQKHEGSRTCVVFIGRLMYYRERMWKFDGSYHFIDGDSKMVACPSWFPLMLPEEIMGGSFTEQEKERLAGAMKLCLEAGAKRLAKAQYGS